MANPNKRIIDRFTPEYDELSTYVITLACILLVISHKEIREMYVHALSVVRHKEVGWLMAVSALAVLGAAMSLYHAFVRRPKEAWEKTVMGSLALAANGVAGIACGMEQMPQGWTMWAIFPIWNIAASCLLLYQIGLVPDNITDDEASLLKVVLATGTLLAVFAICEWYLKLTSARTFSVSIAYASLSGHLFKRTDYMRSRGLKKI
jgi:hypothetical protein